MNKIILIGNGFDIAHGFKTSYNDFLSEFWKNKISKILNYNDAIYEDEDLIINIKPELHKQEIIDFKTFNNASIKTMSRLQFKNQLLKSISLNNENNWVDIEQSYYNRLINLVKSDNNVNQINNELKSIEKYLVKYLLDLTTNEIDKFNDINTMQRIKDIINKPILPKELNISEYTNIKKEALKKIEIAVNTKIKLNKNFEFYTDKQKTINDNINPDSFNTPIIAKDKLIISFNYTKTSKIYCPFNTNDIKLIHIHGELENLYNPIIFGYGDEIDEGYKILEKKTNNEFLENIKSIKYLETDNYRRILQFLESDKFQVTILGHSCGTSDRTLLNTIFEHNNCCSIKLYYHKISENNDNYSDLVRNITRAISDKKILRDRVVNKIYSEPLII